MTLEVNDQRTHRSSIWRRLIVLFVGGIILAAGVAMIVLPGPAIVFIPLGLAILATEFPWAKKWLSHARELIRRR
jgi:tellurite resistance protein TerC